MKWVGFFTVIAAIVPFAAWLHRNPSQAPKVWILVGFLPFATTFLHLNIALISWAEWSGYVKGAEFCVLDALAVALYLSFGHSKHRIRFRISMALYFTAVLLSALQAGVPTAALFYAWQLARMFLLYAVVARGCADDRVPLAILQGMAAGLFIEVAVAVWQRFGMGLLQVHGTVYHQNLLGMMVHPIAFPAFALVLAGVRGRVIACVPPAGIIVDVLTTSRGTIAFAALGFAMLFVLSALRKWTSRKALVLATGAALLVAIVPFALSSLQDRFARDKALSGDSVYDERFAFETAAAMMLSDHPLGIGANNYVVTANTGGYNEKAGVAPTADSYGAIVHNIYWLVAAETGYPGIITFLLLLFRPLSVAFFCGWRSREDKRGDLLIGLGVALLTIYIHSLFEWVSITFEPQYLLAIQFGLVAGLAEQLGYWAKAKKPAALVSTPKLIKNN